MQVSFDIECASLDGSFPDPDREGCEVTQIGSTVQLLGASEPLLKHIVTLKKCNPIEGVQVESYQEEKDVILAWVNLLRTVDADIVIGWNTFQFDLDYIFRRCARCGIGSLVLGKLLTLASTSREMTLQSAAYGSNTYNLVSSPGVLHLDIMEAVKRELKLPRYSLKAASLSILGGGADDQKVDLSPKDLFRLYEEGLPSGITEYCVRDTLLPLRIADKLHTVGNYLEMAKCSFVAVDSLLKRGMQIKVFSLILKATMAQGFIMPASEARDFGAAKRRAGGGEGYEGATVLEPEKGFFMDCIVTLDFSSLYPSIIRAHNLSYENLVLNPAYDNLAGVEYATFDWNEGGERVSARFVQSRPGILPQLLENLAVWRKDAKRQMSAAQASGDAGLEAIWNGKQLAYKILTNSVYGFRGATKGMLPCVQIVAAVTSIGRAMIESSKKFVEEAYVGTKVICGGENSIPSSFH
jgi:DNA polymerase delta subunit 1